MYVRLSSLTVTAIRPRRSGIRVRLKARHTFSSAQERRLEARDVMTLHVNGTPKELPDGATVAHLIESQALGGARVAVEVNKELVVKKAWGAHVLNDGDRVEVVTFVGGG